MYSGFGITFNQLKVAVLLENTIKMFNKVRNKLKSNPVTGDWV